MAFCQLGRPEEWTKARQKTQPAISMHTVRTAHDSHKPPHTTPHRHCTLRFGSTTKVLAKCMLKTCRVSWALHSKVQGACELACCRRSSRSSCTARTPCAPQLVHQRGPGEPHAQPSQRCGRPCNGGPACRQNCACAERQMLASPGCSSDIPAAHMVALAQPFCDFAASFLQRGICVVPHPLGMPGLRSLGGSECAGCSSAFMALPVPCWSLHSQDASSCHRP